MAIDTIKQLFRGEAVIVTDKLHSPEHDQSFSVQDAKLKLSKEQGDTYKLCLNINGQNIFDWFKQKYQELKQATRPYIRPIQKPEMGKSKGIKR
ncbi:MAG: hypothetical protein LBF70_01060 [Holosporales bacterium]|nr:hypothetical protein [Holosporales bacterium]